MELAESVCACLSRGVCVFVRASPHGLGRIPSVGTLLSVCHRSVIRGLRVHTHVLEQGCVYVCVFVRAGPLGLGRVPLVGCLSRCSGVCPHVHEWVCVCVAVQAGAAGLPDREGAECEVPWPMPLCPRGHAHPRPRGQTW